MARDQAGNTRSGDLVERREEFIDLRRGGVGDKDDVLVVDGKLLREGVRFPVAKVEAAYDPARLRFVSRGRPADRVRER